MARLKRNIALVLGVAGLIMLVAAFTGPFVFIDSVAPFQKQCWSATECAAKLQECKTARTSYVDSNPGYDCDQCYVRCGVGMSYTRHNEYGCTFISGPGALAEAMFSCKVRYDETKATKTVCAKSGSVWSGFIDGDYKGYDVYGATENDKLLTKQYACSYACRQVDDRRAICIAEPKDAEVLDYEHRCLLISGRHEVWQVSSLNRLITRLDICTDNELCKDGACVKVSVVTAPAVPDPDPIAICEAGSTADYACPDGSVGKVRCVDGVYDSNTAECLVSTCLNYQVMGDDGQCHLSLPDVMTSKGAADFWEQNGVGVSMVAGALLIGLAILIYRR